EDQRERSAGDDARGGARAGGRLVPAAAAGADSRRGPLDWLRERARSQPPESSVVHRVRQSALGGRAGPTTGAGDGVSTTIAAGPPPDCRAVRGGAGRRGGCERPPFKGGGQTAVGG